MKGTIGYILTGVIFYVGSGCAIGYLFHIIMKMRGF